MGLVVVAVLTVENESGAAESCARERSLIRDMLAEQTERKDAEQREFQQVTRFSERAKGLGAGLGQPSLSPGLSEVARLLAPQGPLGAKGQSRGLVSSQTGDLQPEGLGESIDAEGRAGYSKG